MEAEEAEGWEETRDTLRRRRSQVKPGVIFSCRFPPGWNASPVGHDCNRGRSSFTSEFKRFKAISSTQAVVARQPQIRNRLQVTLYSGISRGGIAPKRKR